MEHNKAVNTTKLSMHDEA